MFQNLLMSTITPLQNMNEHHSWQNRPFVGIWPENQESKESGITRTIQKKPKRDRVNFSAEQLSRLEQEFQNNKYVDLNKKLELAFCLKLSEKRIKVWFQNRRMKEKSQRSQTWIKNVCSPMKSDQITSYPDEYCQPSNVPQLTCDEYNSGYNYVQSTYEHPHQAYQFPVSAHNLQNIDTAFNDYNSSNSEETHTSEEMTADVIGSECFDHTQNIHYVHL